ncbi:penicillin-binding protein 1C [Capnocytophaga felis]|uniref:peptidoglycan glycosyltransferase n=1 Tax=Capnocytophaga felis TaxID=2267611 RepID=A0A5M4BCB0_9FLAO|nr:penicillin-binding protein 1C [Capnocytophaga felis]GET47120.1 penicillin-binding protein 1C [Capnocytophaga felis]GET49596.1 penicillin-binding protein 1C [Capnocytophaga felis]
MGKIQRNPFKFLIIIFSSVWYYFSLPKYLFPDNYATVLESSEGNLLGAKIAQDGQWRFPQTDSIPYRFKTSLLHFEDEYFNYHWGINPVSIGKALFENLKKGKVVRGGSTLTQQVIRLSRENQKRTYFEKLTEMILATRLEFRHSKEEILSLYASHAPFGGNVVGLDMASWRYFGIAPHQLSWGQSATLAVLPNAPSLIFPGKNQTILKEKRDKLLKKLHEKNIFDKETYELALLEPLPQKPHKLPQTAPHLLDFITKKQPGQRIRSTLKMNLQEKVNQIVGNYYKHYSQSEVYNMAAIVIDVQTRNILAYVGNTPTDENHQKDVDIIHAPRSTGSILKPILYAAMLHNGDLLPKELIPDIPTQISGYSPQNFNNTFEGAVPADMALAKSLNIPFVWLLQKFGTYRFYDILQKLQLSDIKKHPDHYGLSIILGGAESNLWDLARAYTNLASELNIFAQKQMYRTDEFQELRYNLTEKTTDFGNLTFDVPVLRAGAIWKMFEAMKEVNRPTEDVAWKYYESSRKIAWKTGTSFGNKDAWAIGTTPEFVVAVWVGNATGEGRPTLTGASYAAPVMFEIFNALPPTSWFSKPYDDLEELTVCEISGFLAKEECPKKSVLTSITTNDHNVCPYHKVVHLDKSEQFQVNTSCESLSNIVSKSWFVLPPVMEWYYKNNHINYQNLPPFREDCSESNNSKRLDFIYPKHKSVIYTTKNFGGKLQPFIAKAASSEEGNIFWYLNETYLGSTNVFHEIKVYAPKGDNILRIINTKGEEKVIQIIVQ